MSPAEPARVYISYSPRDEDLKDELLSHLSALRRQDAIRVFHNIAPAQDWARGIATEIKLADIILLLISSDYLASDYCYDVELKQALEQQAAGEAKVVPVLLRPVNLNGMPFDHLQHLPENGMPVTDWDSRDKAFAAIAEGILRISSEISITTKEALSVDSVELLNIRCFEHLKVSFGGEENPADWTVILGDNSTGKTTLLRSIALGVCAESDAAFLVKQLPGSLIRKGKEEGKIKVHLKYREDISGDNGQTFTVITRISKAPDSKAETVRQETTPEVDFPWSDIFICGYGAHRGGQADASHDSYSSRDAVSPLFDSKAALQNPELVLLRQTADLRDQLKKKLLKALMLDLSEEEIVEPDEPAQGLSIRSTWGTFPFDVLSDGYLSTSQWILDFFGWAIYDNRLGNGHEIEGVVLIDEIEQHLHPRWQRRILARLHQQFPRVQFIVTTHAPMCVIGTTDLENDECKLIVLAAGEDQVEAIQGRRIPRDQRADQVLTSYLFGLPTAGDNAIREAINRFAELQSRPEDQMKPEDVTELRRLEAYLDKTIGSAENEFEQEIVDSVREVLRKRKKLSDRVLSKERRAVDLATLNTLRGIISTGEGHA